MRVAVIGVLLFGLMGVAPAEAGVIGDGLIAVGWQWPQGDYGDYSDPGLSFRLRATAHIKKGAPLMGWLGAGFSSLGVERRNEHAGSYGQATRAIENDLFFTALGVQLGNPTRRGFFRPRAGIGAGVYFFHTTSSLTDESNGEVLESGLSDTEFETGWRAFAGADFYFKPNFGISFDLTYDQLFSGFDLPIDDGGNASITPNFVGVSVGVTVPFGAIVD